MTKNTLRLIVIASQRSLRQNIMWSALELDRYIGQLNISVDISTKPIYRIGYLPPINIGLQ